MERRAQWEETQVGHGWDQFTDVFSTGKGLVYAVQPDGEFLLHTHTGFADGGGTSAPTRHDGKVAADNWHELWERPRPRSVWVGSTSARSSACHRATRSPPVKKRFRGIAEGPSESKDCFRRRLTTRPRCSRSESADLADPAGRPPRRAGCLHDGIETIGRGETEPVGQGEATARSPEAAAFSASLLRTGSTVTRISSRGRGR